VKARVVRRAGKGGGAAAHLRYIRRDGTSRDGERGVLYGADTDRVDGKAFLERGTDDRHLSDELGEKLSLVVDGIDGRVHHIAGFDAAQVEDIPNGAIVEIGAAIIPGPRPSDRAILAHTEDGIYHALGVSGTDATGAVDREGHPRGFRAARCCL
jgi:hypothetical protein